jgi:hypothetical protein
MRLIHLAAISLREKTGNQRAVERLIETLENGDEDVRRAAVKALGQVGDPRAVEPLIFVLQCDYVHHVRKAAAAALARIYREGKLDAYQKQRILALEGTQIVRHHDKWATGCSGGQHSDEQATVFRL